MQKERARVRITCTCVHTQDLNARAHLGEPRNEGNFSHLNIRHAQARAVCVYVWRGDGKVYYVPALGNYMSMKRRTRKSRVK